MSSVATELQTKVGRLSALDEERASLVADIQSLSGNLGTATNGHVSSGHRGRPKAKAKAATGETKRRGRPPKTTSAGGAAAAPKRGRGRPKKSESADRGRGATEDGGTLVDLIQKILSKSSQGLELKDIVEKVIKGGYKSNSAKGSEGVSNIVYQTVNRMRSKLGMVKKDENKRYSLSA